jgi:hypothetical protein
MSYTENPDTIKSDDEERPEQADLDADGTPDDEDDEGVDKAKWPDIHKDALLEYERAWERERMNIDEAYDDLRFRRGRVSDQWDAVALTARVGRPTHVNNKIPKFIRQVTGDQRQMRPSVEVVPVDSNADVDVAEIRGGIIRYIENRSHAKYIYNQAGDSQVTCGIGHWQVETEYAEATTFNQEIRISLVEDGVAVLWDADSSLLTREDADHCFVPIDQSTAKFKRDWPDATASGFDTALCGTGTSGAFDAWAHDDYIRVLTYWKKKPKTRMLALLPDGSVEDLTEQFEDASPDEAKAGLLELKRRGVRVEKRRSYEICRYLLTAHEILEEKPWKGMHIPVIPVIGEEVRIGREVYRTGLCRPVKDLQKMVNYYASSETEIVALQPKAPFLGTKKMFQDRYDLWDTANTENHPFLEYTPDSSAPGAKPERIQPPVASQAIQQGAINAANDMKEVLGIYDSNLGAKSNEQSGVAIKARDQQGDTGTFVYIDNMALAIQRTGVIINDLIPHVYDTQRQMRIIGNDGKRALKTINQAAMAGGQATTVNDVTVGAYDVEIEQGPSYTTKREQARDGMTEFIRAVPAAAPLIGDLIAEVMDWPKAREIGERLQEMLPPPIKQKLEQEEAEREQASGKPPKPPSPQEQQQKQQADEAKQKQEALQEQEIALKMAEQKAKTDKTEAEARQANAEADRAEIEAQILKQKLDAAKQALAEAHMGSIRNIEEHDHAIEGMVQDRHHAQDAHGAAMVNQGLAARAAMAAQAGDGADAETGQDTAQDAQQ